MNLALWIIQGVLALHTVLGALWKFANSTQAVPSLSAIPQGAWIAISVVELVCAAGLMLPLFQRSLAMAAPAGAAVIGAILLAYCVVHLATGHPFNGQVVYWLVVTAICAVVIYGRLVLRPL